MKSRTSFLLIIFSIIIFFNFSLSNFIDEKKEIYENSTIYVSNNPKMTIDVSYLKNNIEVANNIISSDGEKVFFTDFSNIKLNNGGYPKSKKEYISINNTNDKNCVGVYESDLSTMGYDKIYAYTDEKTLSIVSLTLYDLPNKDELEFLNGAGFVEVDSENVNKIMGLETYSLVSMMLNVFLIILLLIVIMFLISGTFEHYVKYKKKFEIFKSIGSSSMEAGRLFLKMNKNSLISSLVISFFSFSILHILNMFMFNSFDLKIFFIELILFLVFFIFIVLYYFITASTYYSSNIANNSHPKNKKGLTVFTVLGCAVALIVAFFNIKVGIIIALVVFLLNVEIIKSFKIKLIFDVKKIFITVTIAIVSIVFWVSAVVVQIPIDALERRDNTINTTIVKNSVYFVDKNKTDMNTLQFIEDDKYYYINPNDGIVFNDERFYPLLKSTDLTCFNAYLVDGDVLNNSSIAVAQVFANTADIKLGDILEINNRKLEVTNIVNSSEYAGQVIYMSRELFKSIYGNTGTEYYISNLNIKQLEEEGVITTFYNDKEMLFEIYNNSLIQIMIIPFVIFIILLIIGVLIIFQIFNMLILSSQKNINTLRALGMSKKEFCCEVFVFLTTIGFVAILTSFILYTVLAENLQEIILKVSGSFISFNVSCYTIIMWILTLITLNLIITFKTHKQITKNTIYEQYKLAEIEV